MNIIKIKDQMLIPDLCTNEHTQLHMYMPFFFFNQRIYNIRKSRSSNGTYAQSLFILFVANFKVDKWWNWTCQGSLFKEVSKDAFALLRIFKEIRHLKRSVLLYSVTNTNEKSFYPFNTKFIQRRFKSSVVLTSFYQTFLY